MSRKNASSFREDSYSSEELEEAIDLGEVGYCEVEMHYDWSDNIHGYIRLDDPTDTVSFCDDCEPEALDAVVDEAIGAKLDHAEALRRVEAFIKEGHYDAETGARLAEAVETHRLQKIKDAEVAAEEARWARGEFHLGPMLATEAKRVAEAARAEFGKKIEEDDLLDWWMDTISLKLDSQGVTAALADTPDALAYQLAFDELHEEYGVEAVTPGWMVGEAAWQLVRDEARKQLGLPSLYVQRKG